MRWVPLCVLLIVGAFGCGGSASRPYPVSGQVTYRKKPLAEAVVTFHPKTSQPPGHPLSATTDAQGRFKLTTKTPNDGASPGDYTVTVVLREKRRDGDEEVRNGRNLLPSKYSEPGTSGLTATVKPQDNVLEPFALTD
jgi:hypothetical protein